MDIRKYRRCASCATAPLFRSAHRLRGMSLVELMVGIAMASIAAAIAVPSFQSLQIRHRLAGETSAFVSTLHLGRSAAVKHYRRMFLCTSRSGLRCERTHGWHEGWIMFPDQDRDGERDPGEPIVHRRGPAGHNITITSGQRWRIVFQTNGTTPGSNATFSFCYPGHAEHARAVILSNTGRARISRERPGGGPLPCS